MKAALKRLPIISQLVAQRRTRMQKRRQEKQIVTTIMAATEFLKSAKPRMFQFGTGGHPLEGWLNTDFQPWADGVYHLDMTKPLPFPDGSLDVAASEHCFEHFSYEEGKNIASELLRCLRPGGLVRMSMPDLDKYIDLWRGSTTGEQKAYMQAYLGIEHAGDPVSACMTLNLAMRSFGHKFIYDRATLCDLLTQAGFVDVRFATPADRSALRLLEFIVRGVQGNPILDSYETLIVEAEKPRG
jgi:predicted SAM-dependent methyltransferase